MCRKLIQVYAEFCVDAPLDVSFEQKRKSVSRHEKGEDCGGCPSEQEPETQRAERHFALSATK